MNERNVADGEITIIILSREFDCYRIITVVFKRSVRIIQSNVMPAQMLLL